MADALRLSVLLPMVGMNPDLPGFGEHLVERLGIEDAVGAA